MSKYKKGDKFLIEIAERHTHYTDSGKEYNLYRIKGFNSLVFDDYGLDKFAYCTNFNNIYSTNCKKGTIRAKSQTNKYQVALDTLNNFVSNDGASCDQDVLENAVKTLQELIDAFFKTTKTDYQEAIDVLADRELDEVEIKAIEDLENLLYQYKMRLADAELLNKLRKETNTSGDLDLIEKIMEGLNGNK